MRENSQLGIHKENYMTLKTKTIYKASITSPVALNLLLTGRRHDGDRRFIKWTRFFVKASWLNI